MPHSRLLHNPRCSKSRAALALLEAHGVRPTIVPYLDQPLTAAELHELVARLGLPARALLRDGEPEFAALGLGDDALSDDALIDAMAAHPRLIERPVFVHGARAIIGRPPGRVLELLPDGRL